MRTNRLRNFLIAGLLVATGCATSAEWQEWKAHSSHYASGDHLVFSARNNRDGSRPRVTRTDFVKASDEAWWGDPITVNQDQILER